MEKDKNKSLNRQAAQLAVRSGKSHNLAWLGGAAMFENPRHDKEKLLMVLFTLWLDLIAHIILSQSYLNTYRNLICYMTAAKHVLRYLKGTPDKSCCGNFICSIRAKFSWYFCQAYMCFKHNKFTSLIMGHYITRLV